MKRWKRAGRAIGRTAYWAAANRLPHRLVAFPAPGGRLYLDVADSPAMAKRALWLYERRKRHALVQTLRRGMTFVDVGANIGDFSLVAARQVGHSGRVLAVEPHPDNCEQLRRSLSLNGYDHVEVHQVALSSTDGSAQLHLGDRAAWHTLLQGLDRREAGAIEVTTRTMDALIAQAGNPPVHVMKVDVEGAEMQVLRGAEETLAHNREIVLLLDLHPGLGVDISEVDEFLTERGFTFFDMGSWKPLARIPAGAGETLARRV
jgi:FkbM family methyltransferase